jgi:ligand-binding SRPBCC domain-containing protein
MKTYALDTHIWLPQKIERVFAFFADPRNLEVLTPPWLHFALLTPDPIEMRAGTRLDYRLRVRGIPVRWQSEIALWEPPDRFIDRQTKGPYRYWQHTHSFRRHDGGTLVEDHVRYANPGGAIVKRLIVAPDLQRIFSFRHEALRKLFDSGAVAL